MGRHRSIGDETANPVLSHVTLEVPARKTRNLQTMEGQSTVEVVVRGEARPAPVPRRRSQRQAQADQGQEPVIVTGHLVNRQDEENARLGLFAQHKNLWGGLICMVIGVLFVGVLLSAGMLQRPSNVHLIVREGGQVYDMQVGADLAESWQNKEPLPPLTPISKDTRSNPYSVLGKPSITVDQINQVLAAYQSPAIGKGKALYDLGVQYGIDPAFALAFFMHESTFGKNGMAAKTLSLGNLRCIPDHKCEDNFAWFDSWEDGFKSWYELIRNLYVAQWGRVTVAQIIPKYAPSADNNNEQGYINAVQHAVDVWRSGQIIV